MKKSKNIFILAIIQFLIFALFMSFVQKAIAQETAKKGKHHENHYHLSVFAGFTSDYKGRNGYKLGLEYEWRISDPFGIGGTFDFTGADFKIFSFSVGTSIYPFKKTPLIFGLAVGAKNDHNKWKPFFRTLAAYDFHIKNISLGPMVMWDIYEGEKDIISIGATLGISLH